MSRERPVRIALIGAGQWAWRHHLPAVRANANAVLVGVGDTDPDRADRCARHFSTIVQPRDRLLDSAVTDAVVIATPAAAHAELVHDALAGGLHVLVEKPFTLSAADAVGLTSQSRSSGRHLVVGYTYQFTRAAARLQELLAGHAIGDVLMINALFASMVEALYRDTPEFYDDVEGFGGDVRPARGSYADPRQSGGGQAQTQLSHDAGLVSWVTGQGWHSVSAYVETRDLAVDLIDAVSFTMNDGALGTFASTGSLRRQDRLQHHISFFGTDGWARLDLEAGTLSGAGADGQFDVAPGPGERAYPTHAPLDTLVDLVRGVERTNPAPAEDAARAVAFTEAVYGSARLCHPLELSKEYA